jgi:hypothetical protein
MSDFNLYRRMREYGTLAEEPNDIAARHGERHPTAF